MQCNREKVENAAIKCLGFCFESKKPQWLARVFLDHLGRELDWTAEEVDIVRQLVVERLPQNDGESG